jgi:hypothetical protein
MSDEEDRGYTLMEMMLTVLVKMAPERVKEFMVERIKQEISVKAGEATQEAMAGIDDCYTDAVDMWTDLRENIVDELEGPAVSKEETLKDLKARVIEAFARLGIEDVVLDVVPMPAAGPTTPIVRELEYVEPTEGCACRGCEHIKALKDRGIRIDVETGIEVNTNQEQLN